jgi:8-oxo-dGTP diphosphatase
MIRVAAGILQWEGRVLVCQRKRGDRFGLKWEFPGGKLKEGESSEEALLRELEEELGVSVLVEAIRQLEVVRHSYPDGLEVEIHFCSVERFAGEPRNLAFEEIAWVSPETMGHLDFLDADRPLVARIAREGLRFVPRTRPGD